MRIVVVALHALGLFVPGMPIQNGGAERGISIVARRWAQQGHEVHLIGYHPGQDFEGMLDGVHVHGVAEPEELGPDLGRSLLGYWKVMRLQMRLRPHIVYQAGASVQSTFCALGARLGGASYVFRMASDLDVTPELDAVLGRARGIFFRAGLRLAHGIICQTTLQMELVRRHLRRPARHIPNCKEGVDKVKSPRTQVLWVGRLCADKQPLLFLELARVRPDLGFRMVGKGYGDALEDEIRDAICALPNVHWSMSLPPEAMPALYAESQVLVCTSRFEGFPNTFLEASLQETPILSLNQDPDHYVSEGPCGLVVRDATELLPALDALLADPSRSQALGQRGRQVVLERYEAETVSRQYVDFFHRLRRHAGA